MVAVDVKVVDSHIMSEIAYRTRQLEEEGKKYSVSFRLCDSVNMRCRRRRRRRRRRHCHQLCFGAWEGGWPGASVRRGVSNICDCGFAISRVIAEK